ncbi:MULTISPECIES: hypothetical protein [Paenibacillus]|uniref:TM2 domain-containing membrane protein YozV n=1 Tax=Paenibacillus lactis TaxID=228574 RepID=A0ABS4F9A9_9BACL|nr:hypothetical protein [Paenibacillus lactis]MBP1892840.1 TM2 domain-containing membrane protein YozV [Paenibacillus lactis]MCM3495152.1 hypothetical protein [Paenibacillus lactis]HAF97684.1 hypothetical protein [Paenibacillus lactis]
MQPQRSKMLAFILNFVPGLGHYYWGRNGRAVLYPLLFFGGLLGGLVLTFMAGSNTVFVMSILGALLIWGISMLDLLMALLRYTPVSYVYDEYGRPMEVPNERSDDSERFFTILLSFIPGLGHFQLGLMQRGLSFLIAFFGLGTILVFLTGLTHESVFLLFLGILPVIWLYCMFDVVQLLNRKQAGEFLMDRTLFEELESGRESGRRSKVFATMLSAFPGAGQMYLGLQKRGLQLMILFLGSIYVLDVLRLSLFLFMIPLIWCYAFFDGLQQVSRYGREPLRDRPIIASTSGQQRWLGLGLVLLGIYFVFSSVVLPYLETLFPNLYLDSRIRDFMKTAIVTVLLIGGGIKLMMAPKQGARFEDRPYDDFDRD